MGLSVSLKSSVEKSRSATTPAAGSLTTQFDGSVVRSVTVTPSSRIITFHAPFGAVRPVTPVAPSWSTTLLTAMVVLAAVVHDPVVVDNLRHPAAAEVHVDPELGLDGGGSEGLAPGVSPVARMAMPAPERMLPRRPMTTLPPPAR